MRDWARAIGRKWFVIVAIYWVLFTIATTASIHQASTTSSLSASMRGLSNRTLGK